MMTVGDWIRGMTDMELAQFLEMILSERDKVMCEKLAERGVVISLIEMPVLSVKHHFKYLQSEMKGE
jgi:hypothetical protein